MCCEIMFKQFHNITAVIGLRLKRMMKTKRRKMSSAFSQHRHTMKSINLDNSTVMVLLYLDYLLVVILLGCLVF